MQCYYHYHYCFTGPVVPVNITVKPINDSALFINWAEQQDCLSNYTITITINNTYTENNTVNTSSAIINSVITGTNYSFIIIPIDTGGREGPPSSLIQYIWNGKNYTHTHSLYFL